MVGESGCVCVPRAPVGAEHAMMLASGTELLGVLLLCMFGVAGVGALIAALELAAKPHGSLIGTLAAGPIELGGVMRPSQYGGHDRGRTCTDFSIGS